MLLQRGLRTWAALCARLGSLHHTLGLLHGRLKFLHLGLRLFLRGLGLLHHGLGCCTPASVSASGTCTARSRLLLLPLFWRRRPPHGLAHRRRLSSAEARPNHHNTKGARKLRTEIPTQAQRPRVKRPRPRRWVQMTLQTPDPLRIWTGR